MIAFVAVGLLTSACASTTNDASVAEGEIKGGVPEDGHPEVGLLMVEQPDGTLVQVCTGTLLDPTHVLTAAHCEVPGVPFGAFVLGNDLMNPRTRVGDASRGRVFRTQPKLLVPESWVPANGRCPFVDAPDVAVLELVEPVLGVTPAELELDPPAAGEECGSTGFGTHVTAAGVFEAGRKRSAVEVVTRTAEYVRTRPGTGLTAVGDSGGPLFVRGRVAGVTSCGTDAFSEYASMRSARSFLEGALRVSTPASARPPAGSAAPATAAQRACVDATATLMARHGLCGPPGVTALIHCAMGCSEERTAELRRCVSRANGCADLESCNQTFQRGACFPEFGQCLEGPVCR